MKTEFFNRIGQYQPVGSGEFPPILPLDKKLFVEVVAKLDQGKDDYDSGDNSP